MNLTLKGRCAVVSGSARGIRRAIAMVLASEGSRVIIAGRTEAAIAAAQAEIRRLYPEAALDGFTGDLADAATVRELVKRFPTVDILVNNLGIYVARPFKENFEA